MSYKLAIFDFDGTLADSIDWFIGVINQVAERHGFRRIEPHEIESLRGYEARQMIQHLNVPMWKMPLVARDMRARMTREIGGIALFPGVDAMLQRLAERGVQLAVVTSNSAENVRRVLGPRNAALIRHSGCGAAVLGKGPKLRKAVRAAGVSPAEAISIGDEIRDLRASRAEGIPFGAVTWGFTRGDALRALQPDLVFETMEEIADIVGDGVVRPSTTRTPGG
ncbi:MAG TPA: HAD hydrolase-like protein [Longimicrobium sp.]|nr:HAD hydrolase-like protein [Longimicrobium sp.]